jgi:hypothetical protein
MIHPNAGDPLLLLILCALAAVVIYLVLHPKTDNPPVGGDDHPEPF